VEQFEGAFFIVLNFVFYSPYGRYIEQKQDKYFGPKVNVKFAWCTMETPALLFSFYFYCFGKPELKNSANILFYGLFFFHYFYRSFIYPWTLKGRPLPLASWIVGILFTVTNGTLQGNYFFIYGPRREWNSLYQWNVILGLLMFVIGWLINFNADSILRNLRKPGETNYKIPRGGMFEFVSGANFFGEIVEWIGYTIASWSIAGFAFAIFTIAVLSPRAIQHHKWYKQKFEDYPKNRKALIPFIL